MSAAVAANSNLLAAPPQGPVPAAGSAAGLLAAVRDLAATRLAPLAERIDRDGYYPAEMARTKSLTLNSCATSHAPD